MITIRRSNERGHANHGWLDTYHSFSFADYYDPRFMSFRDLRVINEDYIEPAQGFPTHGHRDMEIITYVVQGELSHRDSMGNGETIRPHEVQRMTAGTGVMHSEYSSPTEKTHLLQIWILPEKKNLQPSYEQKLFPPEEKQGKLRLVASRGGDDGSVHINQDARLYASILAADDSVKHELAEGRYAWVQLISGELDLNGEILRPGDGAAVSDESLMEFRAGADNTEFLLFDLR
ncbi:pirin family protein [Leptolyngbya sp. 7M]|uniref:pirin family protein n=1 Tax=Leptolyngbya sp. 7M TaxID=2812896 RepID=UPI001B8CE6B7|nr:pirin family protein [Leptolyngbya sp. 7M]QYO65468.1 pirin family protein [Leptolyngbya sp. 7M]